MSAPVCRYEGCAEPVVGTSTQGEGHVCRAHNEWEWGIALVRSGRWSSMGELLMVSSGVPKTRSAEIRA